MFIRIKRRKVADMTRRRRWQRGRPKEAVALDFVVVENTRTPKGPRQRVVKHVGSLLERLTTCPINVHWFYRKRAEPGLRAACADAPPGTFEKLMADMEKKLPRQQATTSEDAKRLADAERIIAPAQGAERL